VFYLELEAALKQIQVHSERWPAYLYGTRRYLLKRFPFVIVYRAGESRIEIVAVAHGRRRPGYWAARVR
jgi:toxin ParE1/3/4